MYSNLVIFITSNSPRLILPEAKLPPKKASKRSNGLTKQAQFPL
jgi:hypothetical protein